MAVYSVSQITRYLRDILVSDPLLRDLWIRGEVGNLARPASGHSYFSLRDGSSSLRSVMFRTATGAELLVNGSAVVAHGRVDLYEVRGDLQLIVDLVQPEGVGDLQLRLEQLKLKLRDEGVFDPSRKRPLPTFPRRVGVVTSPSGAVWQDIRTVVGRRYPLVELVLASTPVQGDMASEGIVEALVALDRMDDIDAIILARGGGSLEDLWPFNEEAVARAVFASRVPVITGVGHETDVTLADLAADRRAPTPSAAAELAVPDRSELSGRLHSARRSLRAAANGRVRADRTTVEHLRRRARQRQPDLVGLRMRIDKMLGSVAGHLKRDLAARRERTRGLAGRLESLSPDDILRRGYAVVQTVPDGEVVADSARLSSGDEVRVTLSRGGFGARVFDI